MNKDTGKLPGEHQVNDHTDARRADGGYLGDPHGVPHALSVSRRKVIADQGQRALRNAANDAVRQHVDLLRDADARLHGKAGKRHQFIQYRVRDVFKQGHDAGRQARAQHRLGNMIVPHGSGKAEA